MIEQELTYRIGQLKHVREIVALFRALCHKKIVQRFPGHALTITLSTNNS